MPVDAQRRVDAVRQRVRLRIVLYEREVQLDVELHLALVKDDAQADALPDGVDAALSIDGHVSPRDLVEDELILALPFAPLHEVDACSVRPAETPATEKQNPFAILRQLKKR